jgi:uncharacterized protein
MEATGPAGVTGLWGVDGGVPTLQGGRSRSTGLLHFPRAAVCPYRGTDDVEDVALSRTGVLWAWTTVTTAPPGYHGPVPYGLGVVELDADDRGEALRVVGRLTGTDPGRLRAGDRMEVVLVELPWPDGSDGPDGTIEVWAFAPTGGGSAP